MSDNGGKGESTSNRHDPANEEHDREHGQGGKSVHGGDLAPPNQDDAGRVIAPQKGDPQERH